jgi:hypothetical protein
MMQHGEQPFNAGYVNAVVMPEVTSDELGRKIFEMQKEKVVEDTIVKIRQHLGREWATLSSSDVDILKYILGEAWVSVERNEWDKYAFSRLTKSDLESIIDIGKQLSTKEITETTAVDEVSRVLAKTL